MDSQQSRVSDPFKLWFCWKTKCPEADDGLDATLPPSKLARPSARRYAASCVMFSVVRLCRNASRALGAKVASGNVLISRTSSQCPCTEECQS